MRWTAGAACLISAVTCTAANAQEARVDYSFEWNQTTSFGQSVFVLGSLPELGEWDVTRAVKLERSQYPLWRVPVSLPTDRVFDYLYIIRNDGPGQLGDASNYTISSGFLTGSTEIESTRAAQPKTLVVESAQSQPTLYVRPFGFTSAFTAIPMQDTGNGRTPGDVRWAALGFSISRADIEFYTEDESGLRVPPTGQLRTTLNEAYVRDGEIFSYVPSAISAPWVRLPNRSYVSTVLGESRTVRILLPRDYGTDPTRRYPVVYMHDGQGLFGCCNTWRVDDTVPELIASGMMREVIVVGIDNSGFENRFRDYLPNGETSIYGAGMGDDYVAFIRDELKPQLDAEFLTLAGPETTGTIGSSLGAIAAISQAWLHGDVFRRAGALSGSWPFSQNFNQTLDDAGADLDGLRLYIDSGDAGPGTDNFTITATVRDTLLARDDAIGGFSVEGNLRYLVGYGDEHNEAAWASRLDDCLRFLYPVTEDPEGLAALEYEVRGDADGDGLITQEDVYTFFVGGPFDFDNDGVDGTAGDAAYLQNEVRDNELKGLR